MVSRSRLMSCVQVKVYLSRFLSFARETSACVFADFNWKKRVCRRERSERPSSSQKQRAKQKRTDDDSSRRFKKQRVSREREKNAEERERGFFLSLSLSLSLSVSLFFIYLLSLGVEIGNKHMNFSGAGSSSSSSSFVGNGGGISGCASIDFGFSQCFGWQTTSGGSSAGEIAKLSGQFPPNATGVDVTEDVKNLESKTFIVTGATGALGRECARVLRRRGCKLVFASRDVEKARAFVEEMENDDDEDDDEEEKEQGAEEEEEEGEEGDDDETDEAKGEKPRKTKEKKKKVTIKDVTILKCDLSSVHSVKSFCREFQKLALPLHGILCLAGVVVQPFALTKPDGVETHFAINHLSHYAMVSFLSDELTRTAAVAGTDGKVVLISSNAHHWSYRVRRGTTKPSRGIDFENLNSSYGYSAINSYGQSKLCPILHAWRISETINGVRAFAVNPGQFGEELSKQFGEYFGGSILHSLVSPFTKVSVEVASATVLLCLTNSGLPPGVYYSECKPTRSSLPSRDPRLATQLCEESDEMIREILAKKHVELSGENEGAGGGGGSDSPKIPRSPGGIVMMTSPAKMIIG